MGKSRRGSKELNREQKLIQENKELKRQLSQLRRQLARIDLDRYETIRGMVEEYREDKKVEKTEDLLESMKKEWTCHEDGCTGFLQIFVYSKMGSPWYMRKCSELGCKNRTSAKKYDPNKVKGIVKE
jgi:hypothetical protein